MRQQKKSYEAFGYDGFRDGDAATRARGVPGGDGTVSKTETLCCVKN
jgi:hypothetical protein